MRITNSMMTNQFLTESNEALNRVAKYQSQVDSTKRLSGIADDPQGTLMALKARNKISNLDLYQSNIAYASSYLKEVESSTGSLNEVLQSAYDDLMDAQNGTKTPEDLKILAEDIRQLRDEVLSIGNSSIGTSYLFGGYNYTGKTNGIMKTPPFSTNSTGDLLYNGIDLSKFSWKSEFDNNAVGTPSNPSLMSNFSDTVLDIAASFSTSFSDDYAKDQAAKAADALKGLVKSGEAALKAAKEFGIDENAPEYQALATFMYGVGDDPLDPSYVAGISDVAASLDKELSYEIAGEYVLTTDSNIVLNSEGKIDYDYYDRQGINVFTPDQLLNNTFSSTRIDAILNGATNSANALLSGGASSQMNQAINPPLGLATVVTMPTADSDALAGEAGKRTTIQIGISQSVDINLTGIELLGQGRDNIYHILDKAARMLSGDMSKDDLSGMITSVQNAQSNVLTLETKIGATQNRLTLINNRYIASELNYTQMRSDAEDADMAESIVNLTTAQSVYNAALAGGAEILKTSLIDFLR